MSRQEFEAKAPGLRLRLASRGELDEELLRSALKQPTGRSLIVTLGSSLIQLVTIEDDESYSAVTDRDAERWGRSPDDVYEAALDKSEQAASGIRVDRISDHLLGTGEADAAAVALLFSSNLHQRLGFEGAAVLFAPDPYSVIAADAANADALDALLERVEESLGTEGALPPIPLVRGEDGEWADWRPGDEGQFLTLRNLRTRWQVSEYERQAALIDALVGKVAGPYAVHDVDDVLVTATTWFDGLTTFLPAADLVNLGVIENDEPRKIGTVKLPDLLAAGKLQDIGLCPTRYLCQHHPPSEVLSRLLVDEE